VLDYALVAPVVNFRYSSAAVTRRSLAVAAPAACGLPAQQRLEILSPARPL
jgi:hypothetical protein